MKRVCRKDVGFKVDLDESSDVCSVGPCVDDLTQISEASVIVVDRDQADVSMKVFLEDDVEEPIVEFGTPDESMQVFVEDADDEKRVEILAYEDGGDVSMKVCLADNGCQILEYWDPDERDVHGIPAVVLSDEENDVEGEGDVDVSFNSGRLSYGYTEQLQHDRKNRKLQYLKNDSRVKQLRKIIKKKNMHIKNLHDQVVNRAYSKSAISRSVRELKIISKNKETELISQMNKIINQNQNLSKLLQEQNETIQELAKQNSKQNETILELTKQNSKLMDRLFHSK